MNNQLIEELYKTIEAKDNIINNQALEIASLNEDITWWTNRFNAVERDNRNLKERIDKARKMIFDNYGVLDKYGIELLDDVLKGDKE